MWHDAIMLAVFVALAAYVVERRLRTHSQNLYHALSDELAALMAGHSQALHTGFSDVHDVLEKHGARVEAAVEAAEAGARHTRQLVEVAGYAEMCSFCGLIVARYEKLPDDRIQCENCRQKGADA